MQLNHSLRKATARARAAGPVPAPVLALIFSGGLLGGLALLTLTAPGCAHSPAGLQSPGPTGLVEGGAKGLPLVVTVTPPPWNSVAEAALGLISAGLATWNVQQHRRLAALEAAKPTKAEEEVKSGD